MTQLPDMPEKAIGRRWDLGSAEYDLTKGMVAIGPDYVVPRALTQTFSGVGSRPDVTLTITVDDATTWRCTELVITAKTIYDATVCGVTVADLMAAALARSAYRRVGENTATPDETKNEVNLFGQLRRTRKRRQPVDLARVAEVYRAAVNAGDPAPVLKVAAEFGKERPTAARYVQKAREAGWLPPTTSGKARA